MQLGITFTDSDQKINRAIMKALRKHLNDNMAAAAKSASVAVQSKTRSLLKQHKTVKALINGKLHHEFGIPDTDIRINRIIDLWVDSLIVTIMPVRTRKGQLSGGFKLQMIRSDWQDVLSDPAAKFITEKTYELEWLNWLLLQGNRIIVRDYDFFYKAGKGRTGHGIMNPYTGRKRWSVPYSYQGTSNHNFATETVDNVHLFLGGILEKSMAKVL